MRRQIFTSGSQNILDFIPHRVERRGGEVATSGVAAGVVWYFGLGVDK